MTTQREMDDLAASIRRDTPLTFVSRSDYQHAGAPRYLMSSLGHRVSASDGGCGPQITVRRGGEYLSLVMVGSVLAIGQWDGQAAAACRRFDLGERGNPEATRLHREFSAENPRIPMTAGGLEALLAADRP